MHAPTPLAARLVWTPDGLSIVLPPRWRVHRNARNAVLGAGAVAVLLSLSVLAGAYWEAFAGTWITGGLGLLVGSYALAQGTRRGAVTVRDQTVTLDESGLWRVWRFRRHVRTFTQIRGMRLYVGKADAEGYHPAVLEVVCQGIQPAWFGAGYPDELLRWVAGELSARLHVNCEETGGLERLPVGFLLDEAPEHNILDEDTCDVEEPPVLKIRREADPGPPKRVVLYIPPTGFEGPSALAPVGCFGALLVVTVVTIVWAGGVSRTAPFALLVPLAPAAAAVLALAAAFRSSRLRARIELTDQGMTLYQEALFAGEERRFLERAQLSAVRAHTVQGKHSSTALRIEVDGATEDFFAGRPADELRWLATVIRQHLGTPAVAPVQVVPGGKDAG